MTLFYQEPLISLHQGHVLDVLAQMEPASVHCIVTSPPYWGLRDYQLEPQVWGDGDECEHVWSDLLPAAKKSHTDEGFAERVGLAYRGGGHKAAAAAESHRASNAGQFCQFCNAWKGSLGLEARPFCTDAMLGQDCTDQCYLGHVLQVADGLWRVLRDDGTFWLNLGDSYAQARGHGRWESRNSKGDEHAQKATQQWAKRGADDIGLKPKDLMGLPWRTALALQAHGWTLRSAITLCKQNPMPESVTDRPTSATEMMFMLTKQRQYFYDADAVREGVTGNAHERGNGQNPKRKLAVPGEVRSNSMFPASELVSSRNLRNWWTMVSEPYPEAHFATFGSKWIEPLIKASTSEKGCCSACGVPWSRVVERGALMKISTSGNTKPALSGKDLNIGGSQSANRTRDGHISGFSYENKTIRWQPTCICTICPTHDFDSGFCVGPCPDRTIPSPVPCTVLDPFLGSGTTGLVSRNLGRRAIGIELSPSYLELAIKRLRQQVLPFAEVQEPAVSNGHDAGQAEMNFDA